jgi:hypothetical protein
MNQQWRRDDGALLRIDRLFIDANWGESTGLVYQFCRESPFGAAVMPSHGRGVSASQIPFSEYRRKAGDQVGHNWRVPGAKGRNMPRHVLFDTNYWKSFLHARLAVPHGDRGDLSLWGRQDEAHRLLAEHLTAEVPVKTQGRNRTLHEWKPRANAFDNHWFDCLVGCVVGAGRRGDRDAAGRGRRPGSQAAEGPGAPERPRGEVTLGLSSAGPAATLAALGPSAPGRRGPRVPQVRLPPLRDGLHAAETRLHPSPEGMSPLRPPDAHPRAARMTPAPSPRRPRDSGAVLVASRNSRPGRDMWQTTLCRFLHYSPCFGAESMP